MVPLDVQSAIISSVDEEKWQRFNEMQEQYRVMQEPRAPRRQRLMHASGKALIAVGARLQQSAGLPQAGELGGSKMSWKNS
jgi:hypothetical protein